MVFISVGVILPLPTSASVPTMFLTICWRNDLASKVRRSICAGSRLTEDDKNNPPIPHFSKGGNRFPPLEKGGKGGFDSGFSSETSSMSIRSRVLTGDLAPQSDARKEEKS